MQAVRVDPWKVTFLSRSALLVFLVVRSLLVQVRACLAATSSGLNQIFLARITSPMGALYAHPHAAIITLHQTLRDLLRGPEGCWRAWMHLLHTSSPKNPEQCYGPRYPRLSASTWAARSLVAKAHAVDNGTTASCLTRIDREAKVRQPTTEVPRLKRDREMGE